MGYLIDDNYNNKNNIIYPKACYNNNINNLLIDKYNFNKSYENSGKYIMFNSSKNNKKIYKYLLKINKIVNNLFNLEKKILREDYHDNYITNYNFFNNIVNYNSIININNFIINSIFKDYHINENDIKSNTNLIKIIELFYIIVNIFNDKNHIIDNNLLELILNDSNNLKGNLDNYKISEKILIIFTILQLLLKN